MTATLESICTRISSGGTPSRKNPEYFSSDSEGHLWVKSKELLDRPIEDTEERITDSGLQNSSAKYLPEHSVLVAMYGANVGQLGWLRTRATVNQAICGLVVDDAKADWRFVFYSLLKDRGELTVQAQGAAQQNLNQDLIRQFAIQLPPLPVQRRIADTLSAYDELIENNQRRIRILEEMARALYREWFVEFRYPGHQNVSRIASPLGDIPEGWLVKEMQDVAEVIDCLHSRKPLECADGPGVLLQLENIGEGGKLDMRKQFRISAADYALWTSRIELRAGDCVVTNVGRVGAVAQVPEGVKAAAGRNMTAIRPRIGKLTPSFLIEYLLSPHMVSEVRRKMDPGTIMDSLNVKGIIRLLVPCPPMSVMQKFEDVGKPIRRRVEILVEQIENLRRTRDLLLPRLLSGREISGVPANCSGR